MDPNRNRKEAAYDALGIMVGAALRGKPGEEVGDTVEGFETDLPEDVLLRHLGRERAPSVFPCSYCGSKS